MGNPRPCKLRKSKGIIMLYRNEKTGIVIDVQSVLGGDWKPVKKETAEEPKPAKGKKSKRSK